MKACSDRSQILCAGYFYSLSFSPQEHCSDPQPLTFKFVLLYESPNLCSENVKWCHICIFKKKQFYLERIFWATPFFLWPKNNMKFCKLNTFLSTYASESFGYDWHKFCFFFLLNYIVCFSLCEKVLDYVSVNFWSNAIVWQKINFLVSFVFFFAKKYYVFLSVLKNHKYGNLSQLYFSPDYRFLKTANVVLILFWIFLFLPKFDWKKFFCVTNKNYYFNSLNSLFISVHLYWNFERPIMELIDLKQLTASWALTRAIPFPHSFLNFSIISCVSWGLFFKIGSSSIIQRSIRSKTNFSKNYIDRFVLLLWLPI